MDKHVQKINNERYVTQEGEFLEQVRPNINRELVDLFLNEIKFKEYIEHNSNSYYPLRLTSSNPVDKQPYDDYSLFNNIKHAELKQYDPLENDCDFTLEELKKRKNYKMDGSILGTSVLDVSKSIILDQNNSLEVDFGVIESRHQIMEELTDRLKKQNIKVEKPKLGSGSRTKNGSKKIVVTALQQESPTKQEKEVRGFVMQPKPELEFDMAKVLGQKTILTDVELSRIEKIYKGDELI